MRLDARLAGALVGTRRECAALIRSGAVAVDGQICRQPAMAVTAPQAVTLHGEPLPEGGSHYFLYHKPAGLVTAAATRAGGRTVMDVLPPLWSTRGIMPVGRLDKDTTGALLLTDDGALAHALLSPKRGVQKEYIATCDAPAAPDAITAFAKGVVLADFTALPARLEPLPPTGAGHRMRIVLHEGKYHQVRRMCAACGMNVLALHRAAFGPLSVDPLPPGEHRALTPAELAALRRAASV